MKPSQRALLFWGVCIPLRAALAARPPPYLRVAAVVIGGRWVLGLEDGHVGAFGGRAWWADQRRAHGLAWLSYALTGDTRFLWADVVFGASNWLLERPLQAASEEVFGSDRKPANLVTRSGSEALEPELRRTDDPGAHTRGPFTADDDWDVELKQPWMTVATAQNVMMWTNELSHIRRQRQLNFRND